MKRKKSVGSSFVKVEKPEAEAEPSTPIDNIGFSFFRVESKGKQELEESFVKVSPISPKKNKNSKSNQKPQTSDEQPKATTSKIDELPKSTIIQHYQVVEQKKDTKYSVGVKKPAQTKDNANSKRQERSSFSQHKQKTLRGERPYSKKYSDEKVDTTDGSDKRQQSSVLNTAQSKLPRTVDERLSKSQNYKLTEENFSRNYSQTTSLYGNFEYEDPPIPKLNKGSFSAVLTGKSIVNESEITEAQANEKYFVENRFEQELYEVSQSLKDSEILRETLSDFESEDTAYTQSVAVESEVIETQINDKNSAENKLKELKEFVQLHEISESLKDSENLTNFETANITYSQSVAVDCEVVKTQPTDKNSAENRFEEELNEAVQLHEVSESLNLSEILNNCEIKDIANIQSVAVESEVIEEQVNEKNSVENRFEQELKDSIQLYKVSESSEVLNNFEVKNIAYTQNVALESKIKQDLLEYVEEADNYNIYDKHSKPVIENQSVQEELQQFEVPEVVTQLLAENSVNSEAENTSNINSLITTQDSSEYTAECESVDIVQQGLGSVQNLPDPFGQEFVEQALEVSEVEKDILQILTQEFINTEIQILNTQNFPVETDGGAEKDPEFIEQNSLDQSGLEAISESFLEKLDQLDLENISDQQSDAGQDLSQFTSEYLETDLDVENVERIRQNLLEEALDEIITITNQRTEHELQELQREIANFIQYTEVAQEKYTRNNNISEVSETEANCLRQELQDSTVTTTNQEEVGELCAQTSLESEGNETELKLDSEIASASVASLNRLPVLEQEVTQTLQSQDLKESEAKSDMISEVRVLTLNNLEHKETTLYRLEKKWILQFRLGPTLLGRKIFLFCNYPQDNQAFERDHYYQLNWVQDEGCEYSDDTALFAQIVTEISGSFHYYFTYDNM